MSIFWVIVGSLIVIFFALVSGSIDVLMSSLQFMFWMKVIYSLYVYFGKGCMKSNHSFLLMLLLCLLDMVGTVFFFKEVEHLGYTTLNSAGFGFIFNSLFFFFFVPACFLCYGVGPVLGYFATEPSKDEPVQTAGYLVVWLIALFIACKLLL